MAFTALGSEGSEQIDWQVQLTRIVHRRLRYRRACTCPGPRTVTAPPAPNPIPKGRFTAAFCARLLYLKFVLGLPVARIVKMLAAEGLAVSEGTLAGVLKALAGLLVPVETAIRARNAAATHVHADETTWRVYEQVQDKTGHKWWLWVFIAEDTIVFRMDATRSNSVLDTQFGITAADREAGALPDGRWLVMSSDFFVVYQSLARLDGVDALCAGVTSGGTSSGPGTPTPTWPPGGMPGSPGSPTSTWRTRRWPPPNPAAPSTPPRSPRSRMP
jgi:transposase